MPRFYFHLHNDMDVEDYEGVELQGLSAARDHAVIQARALIGVGARTTGHVVLHHRIDIEDERHAVVGTVRYGDVLKIES